MTLFKKVQTPNLFYRKFILWIIIIILAAVSGILFFKNSKDKLENIKENIFLENIKVLNFHQKIKELWSEKIEQGVKEEINNIKEMWNIINKAVKQGQEK